jgi:cytochrome P450
LDAFNPFSLGKQNCVGQSLAKAETQAIVARICSEFEFELQVEDEGDVMWISF